MRGEESGERERTTDGKRLRAKLDREMKGTERDRRERGKGGGGGGGEKERERGGGRERKRELFFVRFVGEYYFFVSFKCTNLVRLYLNSFFFNEKLSGNLCLED